MEPLNSLLLTDFFDLTKEPSLILSQDGLIQRANAAFKRISGFDEGELTSKPLKNFIHPQDIADKEGDLKNYPSLDIRFKCKDTYKWLSVSFTPLKSSACTYVLVRDISEFKIQQQILKLENDVLEMNASLKYSLKELMDFFLLEIAKIHPEMKCCIMEISQDGKCLAPLSFPAMPASFKESFNEKVAVGPNVGSCGAAAYLMHPMIVADVSTHPNWHYFKDLALQENLLSAWSFPLMDENGKVLGTFDVFNTIIKEPSEEDIEFIYLVSRTVQILLENQRAKENLTLSNERYRLVTLATNDAVWDHDVSSGKTFWGDGFERLFGLDPNREEISWESRIHKNDRKRVLSSLEQVKSDPNAQQWYAEYRYKKADNTYAYVVDYGFVIRNKDKKAVRVVGAMQDITQIKEHELKILMQNQKLREIAQINSHQIRKPLANILGLLNLMENFDTKSFPELLALLKKSGSELDGITRKIARKSLS